jgi:protein TonB
MFEDVLLHERAGRGTGRVLSLPAAIALHAVALAAVVGASVWFTEEPPEPVPPITIFVPVARPAPGAVAGASPGKRPPKARESMAVAPVVPARPVVRESSELSAPEVSAESESDFGERGDEGGGLPDLAGGVPGATGPGNGGEGAGEPPHPGGDIRPPVLVSRIEPVYPDAARRARLEGIVVLDAIIAASGAIEEVRVVKSAGPLLDSAAAEALRRWHYRPATLNGRAVRVLLTVTVAFRLH